MLTPMERARKKQSHKEERKQNVHTCSWSALYEQLVQERTRQIFLDRFCEPSLYIFRPEREAANFAGYRPKTLRGKLIKFLLWGAKNCDYSNYSDTNLDRFILLGTFLSCFLHACLSDKICERRLHDIQSGSGADWDGDTGILKKFYPFAKCRFSLKSCRLRLQ